LVSNGLASLAVSPLSRLACIGFIEGVPLFAVSDISINNPDVPFILKSDAPFVYAVFGIVSLRFHE
jgi:hypothetical protein